MKKTKLSGTISSKSKSLFKLSTITPKTEYNLDTYDFSFERCSKKYFSDYKE